MSTIHLGLGRPRVCLGMVPFSTHLTHKFSTYLSNHFFSALCSIFSQGQPINNSFPRPPNKYLSRLVAIWISSRIACLYPLPIFLLHYLLDSILVFYCCYNKLPQKNPHKFTTRKIKSQGWQGCLLFCRQRVGFIRLSWLLEGAHIPWLLALFSTFKASKGKFSHHFVLYCFSLPLLRTLVNTLGPTG